MPSVGAAGSHGVGAGGRDGARTALPGGQLAIVA